MSRSAVVGRWRAWSRGAVGSVERRLLLGAVSCAVVLVVVRTVRAGSPRTVEVVASSVAVALGVAALVAAVSRGVALYGGERWLERAGALRGPSWRQQRAMLRALREGLPVAGDMREPAVAYTWMRGAFDRGMWMMTALALIQAASAGRRSDGLPDSVRLVFVVVVALMVAVVVLNAARWRRIGATFTVDTE